jgi:hypothetical protein
MPHDDKRIGQRAGFIDKANEHRSRHVENARAAREQGNERSAKWNEGRAETYTQQISKAAANIKKLISDN